MHKALKPLVILLLLSLASSAWSLSAITKRRVVVSGESITAAGYNLDHDWWATYLNLANAKFPGDSVKVTFGAFDTLVSATTTKIMSKHPIFGLDASDSLYFYLANFRRLNADSVYVAGNPVVGFQMAVTAGYRTFLSYATIDTIAGSVRIDTIAGPVRIEGRATASYVDSDTLVVSGLNNSIRLQSYTVGTSQAPIEFWNDGALVSRIYHPYSGTALRIQSLETGGLIGYPGVVYIDTSLSVTGNATIQKTLTSKRLQADSLNIGWDGLTSGAVVGFPVVFSAGKRVRAAYVDVDSLRIDTLFTAGSGPRIGFAYDFSAGRRVHVASLQADTTRTDSLRATIERVVHLDVDSTAIIPVFSSAPSVSLARRGALYIDSDTDSLYISTGTAWRNVSAVSSGTKATQLHSVAGTLDTSAAMNVNGLTTLGDNFADTLIVLGSTSYFGGTFRSWAHPTHYQLQLGDVFTLQGAPGLTSPLGAGSLWYNTYWNGSTLIAAGGGFTARLAMGQGNIVFSSGPSVAAGSTVTNTTRVKIDSVGNIRPGADNTSDLGSAAASWDSLWIRVAAVVGDIPFLDNRDDLSAIKGIKGSGVIDLATGLELVDDNTLPKEIMVTYREDQVDTTLKVDSTSFLGFIHVDTSRVVVQHKKGDLVRGPSGKPFYLVSNAIGQLHGAVRQLDDERIALSAWVWDLEKRVDSLTVEDATKGVRLDEIEARLAKVEGR